MYLVNTSKMVISTPAGPIRPGEKRKVPEAALEHAGIAILIKGGYLTVERDEQPAESKQSGNS